VKRPALWRCGPALALGAAAAAFLLAPSLRVPGHRGGARVAEGFVPGRWDARFVVARGPAALQLPEEPLRAALLVSGPAALTVRTAAGEKTAVLTAQPTPVEVDLPRGGRVDLAADSAVRLHEVVLTRLGGPPWTRLIALLAASLAAAWLAAFRRTGWALLASVTIVAIASAAVLGGRLGGVAVAVGFDRLAPALTIALLAGSFLIPRLLPPGQGAAAHPENRVAAIFAVLALVSCLAQVLLLPQPLVIGDPAAYHDIGRRFAAAMAEVRGPRDVADAAHTLRPYGGLAFTGLLYGTLLLVRDALTTVYVAHAVAMAGAAAFLVRAAARIGGRRLAVLTGLLALVYPTFPVICGIVQPEPVILLLWTLALDRLVRARDEASPRGFAVAGLSFAAGLALHPQGLWFLLAALSLAALVAAPALIRVPARAWAIAFACGILPVALSTAVGEAWARPAVHVLDERHGFWAYTARMPLGFWLFLDTDGWQGPLRIDETRYARGLLSAEAEGRARGGIGRAAYTLGFVADNARPSVRTVLRNLRRLFEVPDNPFRRGWILPYGAQVRWHRALLILFLLAVPLALARGAGPLLVPVAILAATYPLYHVFNKYAVPATPFILLGAALALDRLVFSEPRLGSFALALGAAALGAALEPGDLALRGLPVAAARILPPLLTGVGLAAAFALAIRRWSAGPAGRAAGALAGALLVASWVASAWGDPATREVRVPLAGNVRHEIVPGADGLGRLAVPDSWLFLDLLVPDGRGEGLRLEFDGGAVVLGPELRPTMPTFGLATIRGRRDPKIIRQWWAVPFRPDMLREGRMGLTLRDAARAAVVFGDLQTPSSAGIDRGLSLGQWPFLSVYRLMHDGEYRLPARQLLEGSRRSEVDGRPVPGALGIRLVVLDATAGPPPWAGEPSANPWRPLAVY
jgi:dolichyl-phosphate-mannose-protein mannosyltransferase